MRSFRKGAPTSGLLTSPQPRKALPCFVVRSSSSDHRPVPPPGPRRITPRPGSASSRFSAGLISRPSSRSADAPAGMSGLATDLGKTSRPPSAPRGAPAAVRDNPPSELSGDIIRPGRARLSIIGGHAVLPSTWSASIVVFQEGRPRRRRGPMGDGVSQARRGQGHQRHLDAVFPATAPDLVGGQEGEADRGQVSLVAVQPRRGPDVCPCPTPRATP
jgi:hypothetical protein